MDLSGGDAFGRISFNDDPGVEALQFMVDLLHKHKVVDPASVTYNWVFDILPGYLDGRVGFLKTWPFVAAVAQDTTQSKVAGLVGFAPNFSAVTSATSQDPHFVAIPATAPAGVDAAWDYIKNRLSLPVQRQQAEAGSWAPIYSELYQEPAIRELFTTGDVIVKSLEYPSAVSATPDLQEWRSTLNAAISRALTLQLSPAEALNQAAEQVTANRNAGSARG
jgi:multiple sugar transport system substrate-binding protein